MPLELNKISYSLDLSDQFDDDMTRSEKRSKMNEIGKSVIEQIIETSAKEQSSVSGRGWKKLDDEYKQVKKQLNGSNKADLALTGSMLGNLTYSIRGDVITWKITDGIEKKKAFNHNTPKSSAAPLPKRQFLPDDGGDSQELGDARKNSQFNSNINKTIRSILEE